MLWCDLVLCDVNDGEEESLKLESGVWEGEEGGFWLVSLWPFLSLLVCM